MNSPKRKIAVIGSGVSGLATALMLNKQGYAVEIFERNNHVGGKLSEIHNNGFRFDIGPSVFTLPELLSNIFEMYGKNIEDILPYDKLPVVCNYFFDNGLKIVADADVQKFAENVTQSTNEKLENVLSFFQRNELKYNVTKDAFIFSDFKNLKLWNTPPFMNAAKNLSKIEFWRTMHRSNKSSFSSPQMIQIADRFATYIGSTPYKTPATLNVISHLEHNLGIYFPKQGMAAITKTLEKLAIENGITIHLQQPVEKIIVENNIAKAIVTARGEQYFDTIVSDIDINYLHKNLLSENKPKLKNSQLSSSALIFYWGVNIQSEMLDLHNILFSSDYRQEFRHLFNKKTISNDPTVYIFISSKKNKSDAPEGCENWYVMINVPPDTGQYTEAYVNDLKQITIQKINRMLKIDLTPLIVSETIATPATIDKQTGSWRGSLYGQNSNSMFSAFKRHSNYISNIKNLYCVGGTVHPGGGIPMCLASAKIVSDLIIEEKR